MRICRLATDLHRPACLGADLHWFDESSFSKLFHMSQMTVEYLLYVQEHLHGRNLSLEALLAESEQHAGAMQVRLHEQAEYVGALEQQLRNTRAGIDGAGARPTETCPSCMKSFLNIGYLHAHMRRRHPELSLPAATAPPLVPPVPPVVAAPAWPASPTALAVPAALAVPVAPVAPPVMAAPQVDAAAVGDAVQVWGQLGRVGCPHRRGGDTLYPTPTRQRTPYTLHPVLPRPAPPCHALPWPTLPCHALPCPAPRPTCLPCRPRWAPQCTRSRARRRPSCGRACTPT